MIGEIRQNFTEASASVGLILATALHRKAVKLWNLWLASFNFSTSCKAGILSLVIDRDPHCNTNSV